MPFFGFTPSEGLLNDIQTGIANKNSSEPLYPLRDKMSRPLSSAPKRKPFPGAWRAVKV